MDSSTPILLRFICRVECNLRHHCRRRTAYCHKGCSWICNQCQQYSRNLEYIYKFEEYDQTYCIMHGLICSVIFTWNGNIVKIFDTTTRKYKPSITLDKFINNSSDTIAFGNRIFVMGHDEPLSGDTYEISLKLSKLIERTAMLCAKYYHTLCISKAQIYSIGGCVNNGIRDCEKYSIHDDKWIMLPQLQTPRYVCAAFVFNGKIKHLKSNAMGVYKNRTLFGANISASWNSNKQE